MTSTMQSNPTTHVSGSGESAGGLLLVLSGPSGVGKTTIGKAILKRFGGMFSVSATTRPPAAGEVNGRDYYFVSTEEFQAMRDSGELLESALVFAEHWYGTPRRPVEQQLSLGRIVLLDIDVQGGIPGAPVHAKRLHAVHQAAQR